MRNETHFMTRGNSGHLTVLHLQIAVDAILTKIWVYFFGLFVTNV